MTSNIYPLISVVIPTYNHDRYITRALQSVLDQTYTNWEVIVVDNHSTDNTDIVLSHFSDPRFTVLKIQNNGVIAASRNKGIWAAKGEWIAFLDSDDWWVADKLQLCLEEIHEEVDVVYHKLEIVSDKPRLFGRRSISSWQIKAPALIDLLVRGNAIATSSAIVRKKMLERLNGMDESPEMSAAEDYNTWLRIAQLTNGFKYVSKPLGSYLLHNQGVSRKDMSVSAQHATQNFIHFLSAKQKNKFDAHLRYTKGRFEWMAGNTVAAKHNLLFSLRYGGLSLKLKSAFMLFIGIARA